MKGMEKQGDTKVRWGYGKESEGTKGEEQ